MGAVALPLTAPQIVRHKLAELKLGRPDVFEVIAGRITALRNDPGDLKLRGKVYRTVDELTVRVAVIGVPGGTPWAMAWTICPIEGGDSFSIEGLEELQDP